MSHPDYIARNEIDAHARKLAETDRTLTMLDHVDKVQDGEIENLKRRLDLLERRDANPFAAGIRDAGMEPTPTMQKVVERAYEQFRQPGRLLENVPVTGPNVHRAEFDRYAGKLDRLAESVGSTLAALRSRIENLENLQRTPIGLEELRVRIDRVKDVANKALATIDVHKRLGSRIEQLETFAGKVRAKLWPYGMPDE